MTTDVVYVSAPCTVQGAPGAVINWAQFRPFQALLGHDAQMLGIAAALEREGDIETRFLTAPEIFSESEVSQATLGRPAHRAVVHLRFGTPRRPRLLKQAINVVVLAEDTSIPLNLGHHPFATGAMLPSEVAAAFVYELRSPALHRPDNSLVSQTLLSRALAEFAGNHHNEPQSWTAMQSCESLDEEHWHRWITPPEQIQSGSSSIVSDPSRTILLPWNLSAPGSLVPNILQKASILLMQNRFPLNLIVFPYNDLPGSPRRIAEVAKSCADVISHKLRCKQIAFVRTPSSHGALSTVRLCHRAWIDRIDPEWSWTSLCLQQHGLITSFISTLPSQLLECDLAHPVSPDESVAYHSQKGDGLLFWRARVMSLRGLRDLAKLIARGAVVPTFTFDQGKDKSNHGISGKNLKRFITEITPKSILIS